MGEIDREGREILESFPLKGSYREMAFNRLQDSILNYPQGTCSVFLDVTKMMEYRNTLKEQGHKVTFGDLYVKAMACALEEHRELNAARVDGNIVKYKNINVAQATYFNNALLEPVMKDADKKDVLQISEEFAKIYGYLKKSRLMRVPLEGATFVVSNMGTKPIDFATVLLSPPTSAIVGIGRVIPMPGYDEEGNIVRKNYTGFSMTVDHGLVDGMMICDFFVTLEKILQNPADYMMRK